MVKLKNYMKEIPYVKYGFFAVSLSLLAFTIYYVNIRSKESQPLLHLVAQSGNVSVVQRLVSSNSSSEYINKFDNNNRTPLHIAARNGNADIIKILLSANADRCLHDSQGNIPLHLATSIESTSAINALLYIPKFDDSAVQWLVSYNSISECINHLDPYGRTPLHIAAQNGNADIIKILLSADADRCLHDSQGNIPLHLATSIGSTSAIKALLDIPEIDNLYLYDDSVAQRLDSSNSSSECINHLDPYGRTPLHIAAQNGNADIIKILLSANADICIYDSKFYTPLHLAAYIGSTSAITALLDTTKIDDDLYQHDGPEMNCSKLGYINAENENQARALHLAINNNHIDVVRMLIEYGAKLNFQGDYYNSPLLHYAASLGRIEIVKLLIDEKMPVDIENIYGETALFYVKNLETLRVLLDAGANVNALNYQLGTNPLYSAAASGKTKLIAELLKAGADPNNRNVFSEGYTAIHIAIIAGYVETVVELARNGVDINAADYIGKTPLHYSMEEEHVAMTFALIEHGANVNLKDENGNTPLHYAAKLGDLAVDEDWSLYDDKDHEYINKFMLKYEINRSESTFIKVLASEGAELNSLNNVNETPLKVARSGENHEKTIQTLISYGAGM